MLKRLSAILALFCASVAFGQAVHPILQPQQVYVDGNGVACAGCSLYSYIAGTTTPLPTYTDSTGSVQNQNPVIIGVNGIANVWVSPASAYKFVLKDTSGAIVWTADNVTSAGGGGGGTPAPPAFAVQLADSTASGFQGDPNITIDPSTHTLTSPAFRIPYPTGAPTAIPASLADNSYLSGQGTLRPVTNRLIDWKGMYSTNLVLGNSIAFGFTSTNCTLPFTAPTCYAGLVANAMGIPSGASTMEAVGGDTTPDLMWRTFSAYSALNTQMAIAEIGTNDMAGVQRNFYPATLSIEPDLIAQWQALQEYMSIDPAKWYAATGSICTGGSWSDDTYYTAHPGCQSHTINDVIQFPNWQSISGGEPVSVLYRVWNPSVANGGQFSVKVYHSSTGSGGPYTVVSTSIVNTTTTAAPLNFINIGAPHNTSTVFSNVLSNSSTSIGPGTGFVNSGFTPVAGDWYNVTVTVLSATAAGNIVSILGQGTGMGWSGANPTTYPAQFWRMVIPSTKNAQQYPIWNQLNGDLDGALLFDQMSGFSVNKLDTRSCLTGLTSDFDPTNFHHPNDSGHAKLAQCALYSVTTRPPSPVVSVSPLPLNANAGTILGDVNLGNVTTAQRFLDNSGQVALACRSGNCKTGSLLTFDAVSTSAYPPTAGARFVGPGIVGNGHDIDEVIAYWDGAAVQTQTWRRIWNSNAAPTVTPTAFQMNMSAVTSAGGALPIQETWTYPASVANFRLFINAHSEFDSTAAYPGLSVGAGTAADPTLRTEGDIWNQTTLHRLRTRLNSVDYSLATLSDLPVSAAVSTATGGTNTGTVTCITASCTNLSGTYTVAGGTFTTGNFLTLVWPTTTTAYKCWASQNYTSVTANYAIGHTVATATGMVITSGVTPAGVTVTIDYGCSLN